MLAYGQTGSGKTFTISGLLGLLSSDLFKRQAEVTGRQLRLICSHYLAIPVPVPDAELALFYRCFTCL